MKLFVPPGCDAELYDRVQLESLLVQVPELVDRIVDQVSEGARDGRRPHTLLVGPSGRGKTHLITTLWYRLQGEAGVALAWLTAERGIGGFDDLLLRIARAIQSPGGVLETTLDDLPTKRREAVLRAAIVEELAGRVLVLAIEDLETCLVGLGPTGRQALRAFLQEEAMCIFIATTPRLVPAVSHRNEPLFGFFAVHHLQELSHADCRKLVSASAKIRGRSIGRANERDGEFDRFLRAVAVCLGGNPRLFALLGKHAADLGTADWKLVLTSALGELAPRYRAVSYGLSPQQQKILHYLCAVRGARTVKEIAAHGAMAHQTASSQLKALRDAELVVAHAIGRESFYEVRSVLVRTVVGMDRARLQNLIERVEFTMAWPAGDGRVREWLVGIDDADLAREWRSHSDQRSVPPVLARLAQAWKAYSPTSDSRVLLELDAEERQMLV